MKKVICFGDSITESGSKPGGWIAQLESRCPSVEFINCGFSGRTSGEGLDRMGEHVLPHLPGILLIQFGINDAYVHLWQKISRASVNEYARHLAEMIRIAKEKDSQPVLVVTHPLGDRNIVNQGNGLSQKQNVAPYQEITRRLALELNVTCIDLPKIASIQGLPSEIITGGDGVHLIPDGQTFLAEAIGENLQPLFSQ